MNINISKIDELITPCDLKSCHNISHDDELFIASSRNTIINIMNKNINKKIIIVGPCSIHNYKQTLDYAKFLKVIQSKYTNLFIVMRVYFEKPRTVNGWKGFLYDPDLDESNKIDKGLKLTRKILVELTKMRIPIATEFLDTIIPQYIDDIISWGCIGARTSESQLHRQLSSGLSIPIGFKNSTSGDIDIAINGCLSANVPHSFLGININGKASIVHTKGNPHTSIVLRGSKIDGNNINQDNILKYKNIFIDVSHDNTLYDGNKDYTRQLDNIKLIIKLIKNNSNINTNIDGIMIESNLKSGSQSISNNLKYGISITDKCINTSDTEEILNILSDSIKCV